MIPQGPDPTPGSPTMEDYGREIGFLLDAKNRHQVIETILKDELELPGYQAKLVTKIIVPSLEKLVSGTVSRGFKNAHNALRKRFDKYDEKTRQIGKWFGCYLKPAKDRTVILEKLTTKPEGMTQEAWEKLNRECKATITQLAKLDQIALALGDLSASITLEIDQPKELSSLPPSFWLRPHHGFIPMIGRESFQEHLAAFCSFNPPFRWTLVTGDGGIGKTRLAHEMCIYHILRRWHAGFLREQNLEHFVAHPGFPNWRPLTNTLMVVDYAADKTDALKKLLTHCVKLAREEDQSSDPVHLRLLLLERHGDPESGWMDQLMTAGGPADREDIFLSLEQPRKLEAPVTNSANNAMLEILSSTMQSWQAVTNKKPPPLPDFDKTDLAHFRNATQGRPLFIQMAAIHACETNDGLGLARWTQDELIKATVKRERKYIRDKCPATVPLNCLERAVAILTFTGPQGLASQKWMDLMREDSHSCGYDNTQPGTVRDAAKNLLGEEPGGISPLRPDILAAAYSVTVLKENPDTVHPLLNKILDLTKADAWSRLLRAVIDLYYIEDLSVISKWIIALFPSRLIRELYLIENFLEIVSVAHYGLLVELNKTLYSKVRKQENTLVEQARILNNLGYAYSAHGCRKEALDGYERAVKIYEVLAKNEPDTFEPFLAQSLNNLASGYSALGRQEEALTAAERTVKIYEEHAKKQSNIFEPDLALSLNNLGAFCIALGRREEAVVATKKAVKIREQLAERNPNAFEPDLADSLNIMAAAYSAFGSREEALIAAKRAVEIRERLAQKKPDAYEPKLADSLNNLAAANIDFGRWEEVLVAAKKAVEICERHAKINPEAFEHCLTKSLNNLGAGYRALGRIVKALEASERAKEIRIRLAELDPDTFEPDLADSLRNVALDYTALERQEEAIAAAERAVEIYERLTKKSSDAFEPKLAMSCGARGTILKAAGKNREAAASFQKGMDTLRRLFLKYPDSFSSLMTSLTNDYQEACKSAGIEPDMEAPSTMGGPKPV